MSDSDFSKELTQFIAARVRTIEQLEILLLLAGNPHKWWSVQSVYEVVKSNPSSVQQRLTEMKINGLVISESNDELCYKFSPDDPAVWSIVNELRDAYKDRSVKVVQAIYSTPPDAVQEFARAFRLRKDK